MKAIEVKNLVRNFDHTCAVDNISFTVNTGEIFSFLGPNGAGKTTTIRILTGQLRPTSGEVWVMGCDVEKECQRLKSQIGVVFEYQNLYERLSGWDNLNFMARLYGVNKSSVEEALSLVGLTEHSRQRVKQYSNGMKQRLMVARAMLHKPKLLFLDEPTRGLDPRMAREVRDIIRDLAGDGVTVFLTTHYMEEADQLSDRLSILDQGRIVALDTPGNLKATLDRENATLEDVFIERTGSEL